MKDFTQPVAAALGRDSAATTAAPISLSPSVGWDGGLLRGTLGATSTQPLEFSQLRAPSLGGSLAADPNTSTPIFGPQGQFTYLPAAVALRNPGTIETFEIAVTEVTPLDTFLTRLPLLGALASALLSAARTTPVLGTLLAPLIGTSQVITFTENPAALVAGRPTAFTDTVTSFDGTPIHINYFPATNVATGSASEAPTVLLNAGLFSIGYTDPDTLYNQYSPPLTGTAPVPGIKVFRYDAFPGVYAGGGGYNVITWDSRGTFASGGQWQFYSPFFEGRDISAIIDWTTTPANPAVAQIKTDAAGVPLVGSAGGSGGGAIQLNVAATDPRIKATVPAITWNSLNTALYSGEQFPTLYGLVFLTEVAQANSLSRRAAHANGWQWPVLRLNPQGLAAFATGTALGWLSQASQAFLGSAGPTALLENVSAPTLLIQGTVDSLVPLRQAVDTAMAIDANPYGTPVRMIWFCGGHTPGPGGCDNPGLPAQTSVVMGDTLRWLDQYVAGSGTPADAIPRFQWFDQNGTYHSSSLMPYEPGFNQSQPYTTTDSGGVLGIVPLLGGSLRIPLNPPADSQVVGSPTLSFSYQGLGTSSAVYASVIDTSTPYPYVVGQIVTPVPVTLDGRPRTVTISLNDIAYTAPGTETNTLALQIGASAPVLNPTGLPAGGIYGLPYSNLGALGAVKISDVRIDMPLRATNPAPLTIPGFVNPYGVAAVGSGAANPGYVYVTNNTLDPGTGAGGTVSVINPNNTVVATLPAGRFPAGVAVSQAGHTAGNLYVASQSGSVSVFDPTGAPVAIVDVGLNPGAVAVSPAGPNAGAVYVVNQAGDSVSVIDATNRVSATIAVGRNPNAVAVSPTGIAVYVANSGDDTVSVIDPTGTVVKTIGVGRFPYGIAVSPAGANAGTVYVTNYNDNTVSVIDPAGTVIATIGVGAAPIGVAVSPTGADAGTVYVADYADGTVSVIGPDNTFVATIPVGSAPIGVAVSPTGNNAGSVYVTNNGSGTVTVIR